MFDSMKQVVLYNIQHTIDETVLMPGIPVSLLPVYFNA